MAKGLKIKLSRVIPSFQLCRSKDASAYDTPVPLTYSLSPMVISSKAHDINYPKLPAPPPTTPEEAVYSSSKVRPKSAILSRPRGRPDSYVSEDFSYDSMDFANRKDMVNWAAAKSICGGNKSTNKGDKKDRVLSRFSDDLYGSGCFRTASGIGEHDQETENLLFSRSFRYDSSCEFSQTMASSSTEESDGEEAESCRGNKSKKEVGGNGKMMRRKLRRQVSRSWSRINMPRKKAVGSEETRPGASVLKRLIPCTEDGKVSESVAVVKKSEDPYEDFKRSMLEMILEKQMFEGKDLEELLQCFLSLNSRQYHGVIVEAFAEIWETLFCDIPAVEKRVPIGSF